MTFLYVEVYGDVVMLCCFVLTDLLMRLLVVVYADPSLLRCVNGHVCYVV
jgi:hypothetical protein